MGHLQSIATSLACYLLPALTVSLEFPTLKDEEFGLPVDVSDIEDEDELVASQVQQVDPESTVRDCIMAGE